MNNIVSTLSVKQWEEIARRAIQRPCFWFVGPKLVTRVKADSPCTPAAEAAVR